MIFYFIIFFLLIFFHILNKFIKKKKILLNYQGQRHQKFSGLKDIPLSGGIFLSILSIILFFNYNIIFTLFIFCIFLIGFMSDINFVSSPKLRLLLQSAVLILFTLLLDIQINETKFILLDELLKNEYFKYFFSAFCLLILINGSNFIDGLNGLMLGYFFSIIFIIFHLNFFLDLGLQKNLIINLMIILLYLFLLNMNNKLFMGDSGSYVLGLICGYFLIKTYAVHQQISPYFIILLLWYPCFENLFSIIRKFRFKRSPIVADNNHFHQLLFFYIKKKMKFKKLNSNNVSSCLIILYNVLIFGIGCNNPSSTQLQILLTIFNIIIYLWIYSKLFSFKNNMRLYN